MAINFGDVVKRAIAKTGGAPAGTGSYPKSGSGGAGGTQALANRARNQLADALPKGATGRIGNAMRATASNINGGAGPRPLRQLSYMRDSLESAPYDEGDLQNFAIDANDRYGLYSGNEPWQSDMDVNAMYNDWMRRGLVGSVGDWLANGNRQTPATNLIRSASDAADNDAMLAYLGTLQGPQPGRGDVKNRGSR